MNYRLAQHVELVERDGESFLVTKAPLSVLRLNRPLTDLIRRGMTGPLAAATAGEAEVLEQLATKGFVERVRSGAGPMTAFPSVSVVIPVKDRAEELQRCLASIARVGYPPEKLQVIVVDDGSSDESPLVAQTARGTAGPVGRKGTGTRCGPQCRCRLLPPARSWPSSIPTVPLPPAGWTS